MEILEIKCTSLKPESNKAQRQIWEVQVSAQGKMLTELEEFVKNNKLTAMEVVWKLIQVPDKTRLVPEMHPTVLEKIYCVKATRQTGDQPSKTFKTFNK